MPYLSLTDIDYQLWATFPAVFLAQKHPVATMVEITIGVVGGTSVAPVDGVEKLTSETSETADDLEIARRTAPGFEEKHVGHLNG